MDVKKFWDDLKSDGENKVRYNLAHDIYHSKQRWIAEEWLASKETEHELANERKKVEELKEQLAGLKRQSCENIGKVNKRWGIGFIISIVIVVIGFSIRILYLSQPEELEVIVSPVYANYETEFIRQTFPGVSAIIQTYWECVLVNNKSRKVSIENYSVLQKSEDYPIYYTNMVGGLFKKYDYQMELPVIIKPNDSERFLLKLGIVVSSDAYEIIAKKFNPETRVPIWEIISLLTANEIDFYGNSYEQLSGRLKADSGYKEQVFIVIFKTGRGRYFKDTTFWHEKSQIIQI